MRGVDPLAIDEPLTQALRTMAVDGFAVGTPSRLHAALEAIVEPCDLPKDAAKLTQVLAASPTVLADAGVVVKRHKRSGVRLVQLIPVDPAPAPAPPEQPEPEPVVVVEKEPAVPVVEQPVSWAVGRRTCPVCLVVINDRGRIHNRRLEDKGYSGVHTRAECDAERRAIERLARRPGSDGPLTAGVGTMGF